MGCDYRQVLKMNENTTNLGLYFGRAGLTLICFSLSEFEVEYRKQALNHLDYLIKSVYEVSSLSFSNGLLGIGWMVEFITQNHYISPIYDSLLEEIDDIIYKWINFHGLSSYKLDEGYLGCLLYFCYRIKGNRISLPYKELALMECIVIICSRLYREAQKQEKASFSNKEWLQLHLLAGFYQRLNIHRHIASDIMKETKKMVKNNRENLDISEFNSIRMVLHYLFHKSNKHRVIMNYF